MRPSAILSALLSIALAGHLIVHDGRLTALGVGTVVISTDSRFSLRDHWRQAAALSGRAEWRELAEALERFGSHP